MKRLGIGLAVLAAIGAAVATIAVAGGVKCTGGPCTGTNDDDFMNGSDLADQISALGGDDFIGGNGGNDLIRGGEGADVSIGGPGTDVMKDGKGADGPAGGEGADTIKAGKGNDRFRDFPIRQSRQGGGTESCFRGFCAAMFGDEQNDVLKGGKGRDYMEGEQGRDKMFGGKGDDVIDAANDDTPGAKDLVKCGDGRDVVFANGRDEVADDCERVKPPQPV
jgi:Ca2+-binding RTX toxin-like protein